MEILNSLPIGEDSSFLRVLYDERYSDHTNKKRDNIDWWLWRAICLNMLCGKMNLFGSRRRELNTICAELRMNDFKHVAFLYHEYRNVARRYLSTCKSAGYASRFMGLSPANDNQKVVKACSDIWYMSKGIALLDGVYDKMKTWCDALYDELIDFDPICIDEYKKLEGTN
ncbi:MAG: hypothetical protein IJS40_00475 [Synergistaceae bacterium]|nr:hypothetical protein [Synergistaceae bacterium]